MDKSSIKSRRNPRITGESAGELRNFQTIKASEPILSIIKGLYDACGMPMYGPAAKSNLPELPLWARNICEQLRLTILKRVLELKPEGGEIDWRNFGRMMGVCQRLATYLKSGWAETDFKPQSEVSETSTSNKPILVPPTELLEQVEEAFIDSMDSALAQKSEPQCEFLSGVAEGYELFLDARGQFAGDRGRTTVYFELLSRWQDIEAMRQSNPPKTCVDLYRLIAPGLGDVHQERFEWFYALCKEIGLAMKNQGRPRKSKAKK
jgi:hypothetical protein